MAAPSGRSSSLRGRSCVKRRGKMQNECWVVALHLELFFIVHMPETGVLQMRETAKHRSCVRLEHFGRTSTRFVIWVFIQHIPFASTRKKKWFFWFLSLDKRPHSCTAKITKPHDACHLSQDYFSFPPPSLILALRSHLDRTTACLEIFDEAIPDNYHLPSIGHYDKLRHVPEIENLSTAGNRTPLCSIRQSSSSVLINTFFEPHVPKRRHSNASRPYSAPPSFLQCPPQPPKKSYSNNTHGKQQTVPSVIRPTSVEQVGEVFCWYPQCGASLPSLYADTVLATVASQFRQMATLMASEGCVSPNTTINPTSTSKTNHRKSVQNVVTPRNDSENPNSFSVEYTPHEKVRLSSISASLLNLSKLAKSEDESSLSFHNLNVKKYNLAVPHVDIGHPPSAIKMSWVIPENATQDFLCSIPDFLTTEFECATNFDELISVLFSHKLLSFKIKPDSTTSTLQFPVSLFKPTPIWRDSNTSSLCTSRHTDDSKQNESDSDTISQRKRNITTSFPAPTKRCKVSSDENNLTSSFGHSELHICNCTSTSQSNRCNLSIPQHLSCCAQIDSDSTCGTVSDKSLYTTRLNSLSQTLCMTNNTYFTHFTHFTPLPHLPFLYLSYPFYTSFTP